MGCEQVVASQCDTSSERETHKGAVTAQWEEMVNCARR